jgi:hypothetical protein
MDPDEMKMIEGIFQRNIELMSERFERNFMCYLGVLSEDIHRKLDIIIERNRILNETVDG